MVDYTESNDEGIIAHDGSGLSTREREEITTSILAELDKFLSTPRFDDDVCVILNMPEASIRKAREKLNTAIWHVYGMVHGPVVGMMDILVAIERTIDASVLSTLLDIDIIMAVAKEKDITVSDEMVENLTKPAVQLPEAGKFSYDDYDDGDDGDDGMAELLKELAE